MKVVELTADIAEEFVFRQNVTFILYFGIEDQLEIKLLKEFVSVVGNLNGYKRLAFGSVDLTATGNAKLIQEGVVVITPTLIEYEFGEPVFEYVGHDYVSNALIERFIPPKLVWLRS